MSELVVLIAEDDDGHARLIERNLQRAGLANKLLRFRDGEEILNFLEHPGQPNCRDLNQAYLLLLDIRMPKVEGTEVLRRIKNNSALRKMPVIMVTTTDDPREIDFCHDLGCNHYITKPVDYEKFVHVIRQLGLFLAVVEVPKLNSL